MKAALVIFTLLGLMGYWMVLTKGDARESSAAVAEPVPTTGTTLALKVEEGQVWTYRLVVDRENPVEKGEMTNAITISSVQPGQIDMSVQIVGFKYAGQDRMKDLREIAGEATAVIPWNELSQRVGVLQGLQAKAGDPKLMKLLAEAGFYCGNFKPHPVNPGDHWSGSVTATGGCTSSVYTFKGLRTEKGKEIADFEVTDIAMSNHEQDGPMKVAIDVATGMPIHVEYKVLNYRTNQRTRFVQELVSVS